MYNMYIQSLIHLRRKLDERIDVEIFNAMRGRANSEDLKECLNGIIADSEACRGKYKEYEKQS